jgi:hypothetical protein
MAAGTAENNHGRSPALQPIALSKAKNSLGIFAMAWTVPWNLLALRVSGDVGGFTIYTDRNMRKVVFPKSPPEKPPSPRQLDNRRRFRDAHAVWKTLTAEQKSNLEHACRVLSICQTGKNVYMSACLLNDDAALRTLERQSQTPLPTATYIPRA